MSDLPSAPDVFETCHSLEHHEKIFFIFNSRFLEFCLIWFGISEGHLQLIICGVSNENDVVDNLVFICIFENTLKQTFMVFTRFIRNNRVTNSVACCLKRNVLVKASLNSTSVIVAGS